MTDARESSRRLAEILRREHAALADFLLALADFDQRRLWVQLGYSGLFYFLHRELGLSKGAAYYRKVAAELVQRFPEVVEPLKDGRLCLTSVVQLARVITLDNRADVLPQFFHCSKREAKAVAAEISPAAVVPRREVVTKVATSVGKDVPRPAAVHLGEPDPTHPENGTLHAPATQAPAAPPLRRATAEPLTADLHRLHVTVSKQFLDKLEAARSGQSHAQPGASAEQVLETALDLLLAQQAKRRGAATKPQKNPRPSNPDHVPASVKREVWSRDEGRCRWPLDGGGICGSTLRLEIDHVVPRGRGGPSTVANARLACKFHNQLAARQVYGDEWMDRFTRREGEGVPKDVPIAREPAAAWGGGGAPARARPRFTPPRRTAAGLQGVVFLVFTRASASPRPAGSRRRALRRPRARDGGAPGVGCGP